MCRKCKGPLKFEEETLGMATKPIIRCTRCKNSCSPSVPTTSIASDDKKRVRLTDSPTNVLAVLAYLSVGDGGTEAQRFAGLLDLPGATSIERSMFFRIEQAISPAITQLAEEVMASNLVDEIKASKDNDESFSFENWKTAVDNGDATYPLNLYAKITGTTDMGWQERGFDSVSGHALICGVLTRKPCCWKVKQRFCKTCKNSKDGEIKEHDCLVNHTGSSASMEPLAVVEMLHELHDHHKCHLTKIITDDDSKMKANCRWSNKDYESVHGQLPKVADKGGKLKTINDIGKLKLPIPQPGWLSDPNHRGKTVRNRLKAVLKRPIKERMNMSEVDVLRISTNFNYMMRQLSSMSQEGYVDAGLAVILHHFDIHEKCSDFCKRKDETHEERKASAKYYRSADVDAELFSSLKEVVGAYTTQERLLEVSHGYDTNSNESMNNIISWMAPKNKCYSGSSSLRTRIAIAICFQSIGIEAFFRTILDRFGIELTPGTEYWLKQAEERREKKKARQKLVVNKKKRRHDHYEKLRIKTIQLREDRRKGTAYATGSGAILDTLELQPKAKKARVISIEQKPCQRGSTSHQRTNHSKCPLNKIYLGAPKAMVEELEQDRDNQAFLDTLGPDEVGVARDILGDDSDTTE